MNIVNKVQTYFAGKKSYIVGGATAADGLYQYYVQHGSNIHTLITYLLAGGSVAAIRAAIAKVPSK